MSDGDDVTPEQRVRELTGALNQLYLVVTQLEDECARRQEAINRLVAEAARRGQTLEEFFALADRVAGALNVLREARGDAPRALHPADDRARRCKIPMCGRDALPCNDSLCLVHTPGRTAPVVERTYSPHIKEGQTLVLEVDKFRPVVTNKGVTAWTPEELARKADLRAKQAATLPTDPVMDALEADDADA